MVFKVPTKDQIELEPWVSDRGLSQQAWSKISCLVRQYKREEGKAMGAGEYLEP